MNTRSPMSPLERFGYIWKDVAISSNVKIMILVCIAWFSQDGKNGSKAFGNTSSRSTAMRAQKVTPTNWNRRHPYCLYSSNKRSQILIFNVISTHHCHRKCNRCIHEILNLVNKGLVFNTYLITSNNII